MNKFVQYFLKKYKDNYPWIIQSDARYAFDIVKGELTLTTPKTVYTYPLHILCTVHEPTQSVHLAWQHHPMHFETALQYEGPLRQVLEKATPTSDHLFTAAFEYAVTHLPGFVYRMHLFAGMTMLVYIE